jgi:hypothetical protein
MPKGYGSSLGRRRWQISTHTLWLIAMADQIRLGESGPLKIGAIESARVSLPCTCGKYWGEGNHPSIDLYLYYLTDESKTVTHMIVLYIRWW